MPMVSMMHDEALAESLIDSLTGLPSRAKFVDLLGLAVARLSRSTSTLAVMILDIDRFGVFNDGFGRDQGDLLLSLIGERLQKLIRSFDVVARLRRDEFSILCQNLASPRDALAVAERISEAFAEPFYVAGDDVFATASVGIALAHSADDRPERLLADADAALTRAKAGGCGRFELYDGDRRSLVASHLDSAQSLRTAIDNGELHIYYQPVVTLADGNVTSLEALMRWHHPDLGVLAAAEFFGAAEQSGLIVPIGEWTFGHACEQLSAWDAHLPDATQWGLSFNISRTQLAQVGLVDCLARSVEEHGIDPGRVCVEIAEHTLTSEPEHSTSAMRTLKALGLRLAVDNFGAAHAALNCIKDMPVDVVKIHRALVNGIGHDPGDTAIVEAVICLAKRLGLGVVAQGVETKEQLAILRELGCESAQGYYFCPPMPGSEIEAQMSAQKAFEPAPA